MVTEWKDMYIPNEVPDDEGTTETLNRLFEGGFFDDADYSESDVFAIWVAEFQEYAVFKWGRE